MFAQHWFKQTVIYSLRPVILLPKQIQGSIRTEKGKDYWETVNSYFASPSMPRGISLEG